MLGDRRSVDTDASSTAWQAVLDFWFGPESDTLAIIASQSRIWWFPTEAVDDHCSRSFGEMLDSQIDCVRESWPVTAKGRLAAILLFDQISRHVFRDQPGAFSFDEDALQLSREGLRVELDKELSLIQRRFFYMPMEHAEDLEAQRLGVECFKSLERDATAEERPVFSLAVKHSLEHASVIRRFGRFPWRNHVLGRESTAEEIEFLAESSVKS